MTLLPFALPFLAVSLMPGDVVRWKQSDEWEAVETSSHLIYVTWKTPIPWAGLELFHTCVHVGCKAAHGRSGKTGTDDHNVLKDVWEKAFQPRKISRASGGLLTYYGFYDGKENGTYDPPGSADRDMNDPGKTLYITAKGLIMERHGQCGAWVDFFRLVLDAQGLPKINGTPHEPRTIEPDRTMFPQRKYFAIKNWDTNPMNSQWWRIKSLNAGVTGLPAISVAADEAADAEGIPGQGTSPNPPAWWDKHTIVKAQGQYYDPSYGQGPFATPRLYEESAFAGYLDGLTLNQSKLFPLPETGTICVYE